MSESTARPLPAEPQGDAARVTAFETFAEQQIYESYKLAMAILASPQDAQDAVHDAFVKAWGRWPSLRDHTKFEAWFRRILVNTCRDRLRAAKHRRSADIADHGHVPAPDVLRSVDERVHVARALTQLEPDDQVLFVRRRTRVHRSGHETLKEAVSEPPAASS